MNYLAHIHIAHVTKTSLVGNFLGDFVKGSDLTSYTPEVQTGIRLHRAIDTFTDSHLIIRELREQFPGALRRMSGIIIDVYFDHLLCRHWSRIESVEQDHVLDKFYAQIRTLTIHSNSRYQQVREGLLNHQWLADYHAESAVFRALVQIERRLHGRIKFAREAQQMVMDNRVGFESAFLVFYPQAIEHGLKVTERLNSRLATP